MLFVVRFDDHPDRLQARLDTLDAHLHWLEEQRDEVLVGGSLREAPELAPIGGLWIVEAPSKDAVLDLIAEDPFSKIGLRKHVEVLHWSKAFDRKVLV